MAKKLYIGVNGVAQEAKEIYVGVNGIAKEVTKGYVGVNNEAKLFWEKIDGGNTGDNEIIIYDCENPKVFPNSPAGVDIENNIVYGDWHTTSTSPVISTDHLSANYLTNKTMFISTNYSNSGGTLGYENSYYETYSSGSKSISIYAMTNFNGSWRLLKSAAFIPINRIYKPTKIKVTVDNKNTVVDNWGNNMSSYRNFIIGAGGVSVEVDGQMTYNYSSKQTSNFIDYEFTFDTSMKHIDYIILWSESGFASFDKISIIGGTTTSPYQLNQSYNIIKKDFSKTIQTAIEIFLAKNSNHSSDSTYSSLQSNKQTIINYLIAVNSIYDIINVIVGYQDNAVYINATYSNDSLTTQQTIFRETQSEGYTYYKFYDANEQDFDKKYFISAKVFKLATLNNPIDYYSNSNSSSLTDNEKTIGPNVYQRDNWYRVELSNLDIE